MVLKKMRLLVISISLKNVFKLWHSNQKNERDISQNFFQKFKNGITCVQIWSFFLVRIFPYSVKKGVLRNFALFTGKHLLKVAGPPDVAFHIETSHLFCSALCFLLLFWTPFSTEFGKIKTRKTPCLDTFQADGTTTK